MKAQPSSAVLTFLDHQNKQTAELSTIDGKSQLFMNSPSTKEEKIIGTMPDNLLSFIDMPANDNSEKKEADNKDNKDKDNPAAYAEKEKPAPEKEENKIVNMKTYSPFSK